LNYLVGAPECAGSIEFEIAFPKLGGKKLCVYAFVVLGYN